MKRKAAEGVSLRRRRESPPVGCCRSGRRQSRSLRQQSHSTRVVVGVEILRHTSAHKGSPLFRRWAPASSTGHPEGSPGSSFSGNKPPGDPAKRTEELPINLSLVVHGSWTNCLLAAQPQAAKRAHRCRREGMLGVPHRARGNYSCQYWINSPWAMTGVVAYVARCVGHPRM